MRFRLDNLLCKGKLMKLLPCECDAVSKACQGTTLRVFQEGRGVKGNSSCQSDRVHMYRFLVEKMWS